MSNIDEAITRKRSMKTTNNNIMNTMQNACKTYKPRRGVCKRYVPDGSLALSTLGNRVRKLRIPRSFEEKCDSCIVFIGIQICFNSSTNTNAVMATGTKNNYKKPKLHCTNTHQTRSQPHTDSYKHPHKHNYIRYNYTIHTKYVLFVKLSSLNIMCYHTF